LLFDRRTGEWTNFKVKGKGIFTRPLRPNFWRVPLDNDGFTLLDNTTLPDFLVRLLLPWLKWKTAARKRKLISFEIEQLSDDRVRIRTRLKIPGGKVPMNLSYIVSGDGEVVVSYAFTPKLKLMRAGLQAEIPGIYHNITWYGRGPQESMLDRKSGYAVGKYSLDIENFIHNYVRPQENANRSEVRWARFTNSDGQGVEIRSVGDHLLNFSAWPFTMDDLEAADHIHELPRRENITLNIDYGQKGVGDLTSVVLGMPEDAQLLKGVPCKFSFSMKAI
jgi:beta-galactosidase